MSDKLDIPTSKNIYNVHIINNLLNKLKIVEFEIDNTPEFDREVKEMFESMQAEASLQLKALTSVENIEMEAIIQSVHAKF